MASLEDYLNNLMYSLNKKISNQEENTKEPEILSKSNPEPDFIFIKNQGLSEISKKDHYIPKEERKRFKKRTKNSGYLYVIADEINQVCKIGISIDPKKRLMYLQTGYPTPLKIFFSVYLEDAEGIEQKLHEDLDDFRLNGEWFYLDVYYLVDWSSLENFKLA